MSAAINQKQIAALAGVSQTVVSRVLSGRAREIGIANETIQRVTQIAERFNYRPNIGASIIQGRKTNLLGVIVRSFDDQFLMTLLAELRHAATEAGYSLIIAGFDHGTYSDKDIHMLEAYRPDAYIVLGTMDFLAWPPHFFSDSKPVINLGAPAPQHPQVRSVSIDEQAGANLLLKHLLAEGHNKIGLICDNLPANQRRLSAFRQNLASLGILLRPEWVFSHEQTGFLAGTSAARYYCDHLSRENWPSAFCAMDDVIALAALREFLSHGISLPGELALTGFDDITSSGISYPSLTTMRQPIRRMVQMAMKALDETAGTSAGSRTPFIPELKVRESTSASVGVSVTNR